MAKKYFLFDCETGGLDPSFSLLTLSGVVLNQQYEVLDSIDLAIKPSSGRYVLSSKAMEINKINIATHDAVAITESEAAVELGLSSPNTRTVGAPGWFQPVTTFDWT